MRNIQRYTLSTVLFAILTFNSNGQIINIFAGSGSAFSGYGGDGGQATAATLEWPRDVAVDNSGNVYICDYSDEVIRKVNTLGIISTFAGDYGAGTTYIGDGGQATAATLYDPFAIAFDQAGNLYISDNGHYRIRKVNTAGIISTIGGSGQWASFYTDVGDEGPATAAKIDSPEGIAVDYKGNIYFSDEDWGTIRKIDNNGIIHTVAGMGTNTPSNGMQALSVSITECDAIAVDGYANVYVADAGKNMVYRFDSTGVITMVAGTGGGGSTGNGGPATAATLEWPQGVTVDAAGNVYITDAVTNYERIRKVNTAGIISTFTGGAGPFWPSVGGSLAINTFINDPRGLTTDWQGNLYITDMESYIVEKVTVPCTTPKIDIDTSSSVPICSGTSTNISFHAHGAGKYLWMPGNITSPILTVNSTSTTTYTLTGMTGTCSSTQTISVVVNPLPIVSLGNDTAVCKTPYILSANTSDSSYLWNTGTTAQQISINNTGTYWVTVTSPQGCKNSDTVNIIIDSPPVINILHDSIECGTSFIPVTINASYPNTNSYLWNNGFTSSIQTINDTGTYWVKYFLNHGCISGDTFNLALHPYPVINLGNDTTFCSGNLILNAFNASSTYQWNNGQTTSNIVANIPGNYWVKVTTGYGCKSSDSLIIHPDFKQLDFVMPNIVTPNNDNINDYIDFSVYQLSSLQLDVFNRWGAKVFVSNNPSCIWKPTEDDGTYFYNAQYQINCGAETQNKTLKGFITLIR